MDSEVLEVMRELGCYSAIPGNDPLDECDFNDVQDEFGDLWIDLGGEG